MREYPWSTRNPSTTHYRWFKNLAELHRLSLTWQDDLKLNMDEVIAPLKKEISPDLQSKLWILDCLTNGQADQEFDSLLCEQNPDELLIELEELVWTIQTWTIRQAIDQDVNNEVKKIRKVQKNLLEQSAWKAGRRCAITRWNTPQNQSVWDLRGVLSAIHDSPLSGCPSRKSFLVVRALLDELRLEMLACPHQSPFEPVRSVADETCSLHWHWIRGFAYGMNHSIIVEYQPLEAKTRCRLRFSSR